MAVQVEEFEEELLPGVPNDLVMSEVLPRVSWLVRPGISTLSRVWKRAVEDMDPELVRRKHSRAPQLMRVGRLWAFVDMQDGTLVCLAHPPAGSCSQPHVRVNPSCDSILARHITTVITSDGNVFAWRMAVNREGACEDCARTLFRLDLCKGSPEWQVIRTPAPLWRLGTASNHIYVHGSFYSLANGGTLLQQYHLETGLVSEFATPVEISSLVSCGASGSLYCVAFFGPNANAVIFKFELGGWQLLDASDKVYTFFLQQYVLLDCDTIVHYDIHTRQWQELQVQGGRGGGGPLAISHCCRDTSNEIFYSSVGICGTIQFWKADVHVRHKTISWRNISSLKIEKTFAF